MNDIPLPALLNQLRDDLLATQEGADKGLTFRVEEIEVELQITATQETAGGAGVKFWVVDARADLKDADVRSQKLRLKLKPLGPGGKAADIAGNAVNP